MPIGMTALQMVVAKTFNPKTHFPPKFCANRAPGM